jgi:hypothetical protein
VLGDRTLLPHLTAYRWAFCEDLRKDSNESFAIHRCR